MFLAPGHTLARYRISTTIGAGGMGEVYRATDLKLGREVALKLLPEAFAADPDRQAACAEQLDRDFATDRMSTQSEAW